MSECFLIMLKLLFMSFWNQLNLLTWDGEIPLKKPIELSYIGRNKRKLINKSDSYLEMKQWLIQNYGAASRIINGIIYDFHPT